MKSWQQHVLVAVLGALGALVAMQVTGVMPR